MPLFGGRRAVWVKAGGRNFAAAVEAVLATPPTDCRVVIEAGDLRRNAPLRAICEKAKSAAVIACYPDNERDLVRLIDDEMREARLTIAPDARAALVSLIGGDRQASRSEIRKLALYAHGKDRVELDDVLAVVADASALALDAVVDAAFAGRAPRPKRSSPRRSSAGTSPGTILSCGAAPRGAAAQGAARARCRRRHRRRDAQLHPAGAFQPRGRWSKPRCKAWTAPRLARAMEQLADAALNVRRTAALADAMAQRALLSLAVGAAPELQACSHAQSMHADRSPAA